MRADLRSEMDVSSPVMEQRSRKGLLASSQEREERGAKRSLLERDRFGFYVLYNKIY